VTLQHNERRCGLGGAAVMPQLRLDSMRDAEKALRRLLIDADPSVESRDFVGLTARERLHMHSAAEQLGLVSRSFGNSKKRFLRVSKRQLTSSATAVQTTDAAAGMNHGGGGGQPLTCVSGLRQQAESAAELVASRAAAGSERLGLGCYPADVGLPATSQPSSTTAADISLHIQHFTRAVRYSNLRDASASFGALLHTSGFPSSAAEDEALMAFANLCVRHREATSAWRAFTLARTSSRHPSTLSLFALGLDLNGMLEALSEADEPAHFEHVLELWHEMQPLHVPPAVEAVEAFIERCISCERLGPAFEAYLVALDAELIPRLGTCIALLRVSATRREWASCAVSVLLTMHTGGERLNAELDVELHELAADLHATLTKGGQHELARQIWADLGGACRAPGTGRVVSAASRHLDVTPPPAAAAAPAAESFNWKRSIRGALRAASDGKLRLKRLRQTVLTEHARLDRAGDWDAAKRIFKKRLKKMSGVMVSGKMVGLMVT